GGGRRGRLLRRLRVRRAPRPPARVSARRRILVAREAAPGGAALDTAVSRELLLEVASGARPETLRLWRPGDALAFSVADRNRPGFARAVRRGRAPGLRPLLRLPRGDPRAVAPRAPALSWAVPAGAPRRRGR